MSRQLRVLARATFDGFFESELMPPGLPQVRLFIFAVAALMLPAVQVPARAFNAYTITARFRPEVLDLVMWPHKFLFITLAMVGTAAVSLIVWDNVFPDRRDAFIIGQLPMRVRTVVGARLAALSALMGMIALACALPSALFYGVVAGAFSPGGIVRTVVAHFVTIAGASVFAFLVLLSLQGILINVVSGRTLQRAMVVLQFIFVVAMLESLLFMFPVVNALEKAMAPGAAQPAWMVWMPPAWFFGLYEVLAGSARPVGKLAVPAVIALGVLLPLSFGLYALTYSRLTRRAVESTDAEQIRGSVVRERLVVWLCNRLTRSAISSAVCLYSILTLVRSRRHRLLLTIFVGVGAAVAATGLLIPFSRHGRLLWILTPQSLFPIGLVLVFFLMAGLRTLFAIPAEPAANWIFKLSDGEDARLHVRGAASAMMALGVVPVVVLLAPLHVLAVGRVIALTHSAVLLCAGFVLSEILLKNFPRVPFTSPYNPPASRARVMWPLWLIGFSQFSYTLSFIEAQLLGNVPGLGLLFGGLLVTGVVIRLFRERQLTAGPRMLTFDDGEEDAMVTLELFGAVPAALPRS